MQTFNIGIYAFDITEYMPKEITGKTGKLYELFITSMEPTYCCEIRPSYYFDTTGDYASENHVDDELDGDLRSILAKDSEPCYRHISSLTNIPHKIYEIEVEDDETIEDAIQQCREDHAANPDFNPFDFETAA